MTHYYLDGYNLIFRLLKHGEDLRVQRDRLIEQLSQQSEFLNLEISLIFDSCYKLGESTRSHKGSLEVIYTSQGETADDYILSALKTVSRPQEHTVITSDKKLAWQARRALAQTECVEQFVSWLERRKQNKLRQLKEGKKSLDQQVEEKIQSLKSNAPPPQETPEHSIDYYLQCFEQSLEEKQELPKKKKKTAQKNESEMERWERLFNEGNGA